MTQGSDKYDLSAKYAQLERLFTFVHRLTLSPEHLTLQVLLSNYGSEIQTQMTLKDVREFQLEVMDAEETLNFPLDIIRFRIVPDEQHFFMYTTAFEATATFSHVIFEKLESQITLEALDLELTVQSYEAEGSQTA